MANYEKLRDAYAIIDGIPSENFNLDSVLEKYNKNHLRCKTIACAAGWLSIHPTFAAELKPAYEKPFVKWTLRSGTSTQWYVLAMAQLFDISHADAVKLFQPATYFEEREFGRNNHKEIWKHRVRTFLANEGQL